MHIKFTTSVLTDEELILASQREFKITISIDNGPGNNTQQQIQVEVITVEARSRKFQVVINQVILLTKSRGANRWQWSYTVLSPYYHQWLAAGKIVPKVYSAIDKYIDEKLEPGFDGQSFLYIV